MASKLVCIKSLVKRVEFSASIFFSFRALFCVVVNTDLPKPFIFIVDHSSQYFSLGQYASNLNENLLKFSPLSLLEGLKSGMTIMYLHKFILTHCKIGKSLLARLI